MFDFDISGKKVVDLSHKVVSDMPADPSLKLPTLEFFSRVGGEDGAQLHNIEVISYCPHTGTHMDAPHHVSNEWGDLSTVNPTILIGPARVVTLDIPQYDYAITVADLQSWEEIHGAIEKGQGVLLHTGQAERWDKGFDEFIGKGFVYLSVEAAKYLASKQVRYVGIEAIGVDSEGTEAHQALLGNDVTVIENICNLDKIADDQCFTIGTFPNAQGATGAWIRLLAICD